MKKIGFVGAGNMAGALMRGLLRAGQLDPDDVWASDPVDVQLRRLAILLHLIGDEFPRNVVGRIRDLGCREVARLLLVVQTGERTLVFLDKGQGHYEPRDISIWIPLRDDRAHPR